ncbi:MAG: PLP-dependent aspartate aminotransferase family protein [bacterium]
MSGIGTRCIHAGYKPEMHWGAVMPPIYQTSTFTLESAEEGARRFAGDGKDTGYIYTRLGNPTISVLEKCVANLEGGAAGLACSSGMGAFNTLLFGLLKAGDHMIGGRTLYGPSRSIVENNWNQLGVQSSFVDTSDLEQIQAAWRPNTKLLFVETPANPNLTITDIKACAELAHKQDAILVVDNTFMSPILQQPIRFGADYVLNRATKFWGGHSDVIGGIIVAHTLEEGEQLRSAWCNLGATMDPHQAWLILRSIKTLKLRVLAAQKSAVEIALHLQEHPAVKTVMYPYLSAHPGSSIHSRQAHGGGSLISFELKGGLESGRDLMNRVRLITLAVSMGGVESLIEHPASMTHSRMPPEQRLEAGISDGLVRLSVGCEDVEDLVADLVQALAS